MLKSAGRAVERVGMLRNNASAADGKRAHEPPLSFFLSFLPSCARLVRSGEELSSNRDSRLGRLLYILGPSTDPRPRSRVCVTFDFLLALHVSRCSRFPDGRVLRQDGGRVPRAPPPRAAHANRGQRTCPR